MEEKFLEQSERLVNQEIDNSISLARQALERPAGFDGEHCIEEDCGEAIEPERLKLGMFRCYDCQSKREIKDKQTKWPKP